MRASTAVIRSTLYQTEPELAVVSRECGVPLVALHEFLDDRSGLTQDQLRRLAAYLWAGGRVFDSHVARLRPSVRPLPIRRGCVPRPFRLRVYTSPFSAK